MLVVANFMLQLDIVLDSEAQLEMKDEDSERESPGFKEI